MLIIMEQEEIVNRVANSTLQVFDLEDYYPKEERITIDITQWLWQGLVLKEKDFRDALKNHDWQQYHDKYVAVYCSEDAIVPAWAYMLITSYLQPFAKKVMQGELHQLDVMIYNEILNSLDYTPYE